MAKFSHDMLVFLLAIMAISVSSQQQNKAVTTTVRPTTTISVNVTVPPDDSSTTISEEETPEPRQASRPTLDLCRDVKGCRCEQNNKMLDCNGQRVGVSELRFSLVKEIPKTFENIIIANYESVHLDKPQLGELTNLQTMTIKSVRNLHIGEGTIGKMENLIIEDVQSLSMDQGAFSKLSATKSATFRNVKFSDSSVDSDRTFQPDSIGSKLEFSQCSLKGIMIQVSNPPSPSVEPSFIMKGCQLDKIRMNVSAVRIEISDNQFISMSNDHEIGISFHSSLQMGNNSYQHNLLPDVSSRAAGAIDIEIYTNNTDRNMDKKWLSSLKLNDMRVSSRSPKKDPGMCEEKKTDSGNTVVVECSSIDSLERFLQMGFPVSGANHLLPHIFLSFIFVVLLLPL